MGVNPWLSGPVLSAWRLPALPGASDKRTEKVFNGISGKSFLASVLRRVRSKLDRHAARVEDLREPPANRPLT